LNLREIGFEVTRAAAHTRVQEHGRRGCLVLSEGEREREGGGEGDDGDGDGAR